MCHTGHLAYARLYFTHTGVFSLSGDGYSVKAYSMTLKLYKSQLLVNTILLGKPSFKKNGIL